MRSPETAKISASTRGRGPLGSACTRPHTLSQSFTVAQAQSTRLIILWLKRRVSLSIDGNFRLQINWHAYLWQDLAWTSVEDRSAYFHLVWDKNEGMCHK